ncbi:Transposase, partial [Dysosmobacter welbionis]
GDAAGDAGIRQPGQQPVRPGLQGHPGPVLLRHQIVEGVHQLLRRGGEGEAASQVLRRLPAAHLLQVPGQILRRVTAVPAHQIHRGLLPDVHGVRQGPVQVKDGAPDVHRAISSESRSSSSAAAF